MLGTDRRLIVREEVLLGCRVTVLGGASVGKGAVIGSHAMVNKDIPEVTITFGGWVQRCMERGECSDV